MTAAWMLYVLLVGTLLACAALAVDGALRRTGMATRWVWTIALMATVVLAAIAAAHTKPTTALTIPSVNMVEATPAGGPPSAPSLIATLGRARQAVEQTIARGIVAIERQVPERMSLALVIGWAVLSAAVFALLVIVNRRVDRARRTWPLAQVHGTSVRIAPEIGPAVVGFAHPEIVVPAWLLGRRDDEQRLVIVHEREHVAARDQLVLTGAWCAVALLPWHPAAWWMLSRLRLAIELDCDARVLHRGVSPRPYGALLIDIAGQCAGLRIGALALADTTTHLERRLLAMKRTRSRFAPARIGVLCSLAALSILVACEARMPTSAEVSSMDAKSAEQTAVKAKMLDEQSKLLYIVDGVVVTAEKAKAIPASQIASIDVTKNAEGGRINIVTVLAKAEPDKAAAERKATLGDGVMKKAVTLGAAQPMIVIDGVKATKAEMARLTKLDIAMVNIIKGPNAQREFPDADAVNGVIVVTTRKATP